MFGTILKMDCGRQNRVNPSEFLKLFSAKSQKKIKQLDTTAPKLNSSKLENFHEPTLTRQSLYPSYFDTTMLRTLYYNIRIHGDIPRMTRIFINKDQSVVFEFEDTVTKETITRLQDLLHSLGHTEFTNPEKSGKRVGFDIECGSYAEPRGEENE